VRITSQLGGAARLLPDVEALLQELPQPFLLPGVLLHVGSHELVQVAGRLHRRIRVHRRIAGVEAREAAAVAGAHGREKLVDQATALERHRLAAPHHMNGGVEEVAASAEGMRVASHPVMTLHHQDAETAPRQQRAGREASDARTHDDRVVGVAERFAA
jgi:hypothetical protein